MPQLDWRICLWACIIFFALQLDRGNINQALSDNLIGEFMPLWLKQFCFVSWLIQSTSKMTLD